MYEQRPSDTDLLIPGLDAHEQTLGRVPRLVAGDAGFYSATNEAAAQAKGVKRVCIPNRSTKSPDRKREQKKRWFREVGFLLLQTRYHTALFVAITSISGELVSAVMKQAFNRPRPSVVPHLREVFSTSFPSGHAMESAIVYLTLGAVLMRATESRITKLYCLGIAMLLTLLVGISRVYLGVHYPTDVIGGWIIGFVWASVCWLAAQHFERRAGITAERTRST